MTQQAVIDLIAQVQHTFRILREEIERFDDGQWLKGLSNFLTPVKVAMHIYDCLDYYFSGKKPEDYTWGYRFGGGWWELPDERLPGKNELLEYAGEVEQQTLAVLAGLEDEGLAQLYPIQDGCAKTFLGRLVYADRHTLHHHGELAALATFHGHEGGSWD